MQFLLLYFLGFENILRNISQALFKDVLNGIIFILTDFGHFYFRYISNFFGEMLKFSDSLDDHLVFELDGAWVVCIFLKFRR